MDKDANKQDIIAAARAQAQENVKNRKKKQTILDCIMMCEGLLALAGGIVVLCLHYTLALGIVLTIAGVAICAFVSFIHIRAFKRLDEALKRTEEIIDKHAKE